MPKKNNKTSSKLEQAIEELQEYMRKSKQHQRSLEDLAMESLQRGVSNVSLR